MHFARLACLILPGILGSFAGAAEDTPLPESQRPGPLVEIQPRQSSMSKFTAYLSGFEDGRIDLLMPDGREKKSFTVDEIASMKFAPARSVVTPAPTPIQVQAPVPVPESPDHSLRLSELVPAHPDVKSKLEEGNRPGFGAGARFWELLIKHDRDLSEAERQEYQKLRGKFALPDKNLYVDVRNEARHANRTKELPAYMERERKALRAVPAPTLDESRIHLAGLVYAYDLEKILPREIIEKLENDLPPIPSGLEPRAKRRNMLGMLTWDILNHGPE